MANREGIIVLVLAAAFFAPYFFSRNPSGPIPPDHPSRYQTNEVWWGSTPPHTPEATTSPTPYGRFTPGVPSQPRTTTPSFRSAHSQGAGQIEVPPQSIPNELNNQVTVLPNQQADAEGWVTVRTFPPGVTPNSEPAPAANLYGNRPNAINRWPTMMPPMTAPAHERVLASSGPTPGSTTFGELFQFGYSPQWIARQWPRVSSQVKEGLTGMRVALVSGTTLDDVAGSLTYYFDPHQQPRRVRFFGTTGDPSRFVSFLTTNFGFQPEPSLGGGMFARHENGQLVSVLRLRQSPVVHHSKPLERYLVQLELNRPGSGMRLSEGMQSILDEDVRFLKTHQNEYGQPDPMAAFPNASMMSPAEATAELPTESVSTPYRSSPNEDAMMGRPSRLQLPSVAPSGLPFQTRESPSPPVSPGPSSTPATANPSPVPNIGPQSPTFQPPLRKG